MPAANPTPAAPTDPTTEESAHHRALLNEILDLAADLARDVHAAAKAQPPTPQSAAAAVETFERIARTIRRTILLIRHLDTPTPAQSRATARRRVIREVEDAIERRPARPGDREILRAELHERLDRPDLREAFEADLATRPIPELIAEICRDLGLAAPPGAQPWKRRTPEDLAQLCTRAAQPPPARQSPAEARQDQPERLFHLVATPNPA